MSAIHYAPNAYYIFDRAYDSFKELYRIHLTDYFFVVRAKSNLKCKFCKWKCRLPKYLQPIITQYFIDNKSEIWLLFLIAHSKR